MSSEFATVDYVLFYLLLHRSFRSYMYGNQWTTTS